MASKLKCFIIAFGLLLWFVPSAQALVIDLSDKRIEIRYSFDGADLILFGAVGKTELTENFDLDNFDVVIVVRGPEAAATVRQKEKVGPIWINRSELTVSSVPGYYAVAATRPLSEIAETSLYQKEGIGFQNLSLSAVDGDLSTEGYKPYREAIHRLRTNQGLYRQELDSVTIVGEGLFRTDVRLPANVPVGDFIVDAYVFQNGMSRAHNRIMLNVDKEGFERAVFTFAHSYPLLYGIVAVIIALGAGWLAGVLGGKK